MKLYAHRDPLGKINFYPERDGHEAHSGDGLTDDVLLVLGEPVDRV